MLRVAEQFATSDTGRQRTANEDSYFARAPLFVVADGMGGARAGEVASQIATEAFESGNAGDEPPEAYLREVVESANARIHELSRQDASRSGMGTTLTAALVAGEEISLAHVGDSRAYLLRDGELRRLTSDHSLVEELRRQGRLTEQQALEHPQRSIITRALGPEPTVRVDTMTYPARPGDRFLLCSDGLTTMLSEDQITTVLTQAEDLRQAVRMLIREANEAGGRDNITAIAFSLEEVGEPAGGTAPTGPEEGATLIGPSAREQGLSGQAVRERAAAAASSTTGPSRAEEREPERRWPRRLAKLLLVAVVCAALVVAGVWAARQVYFLGTDEGGRITLYRGLPYDLPFDLELYSEVYSSPTQVSSLPEDRRDSVTEHELRSHEDATSLIEDLEQSASPPIPADGDKAPAQRRPSDRRDGSVAQRPGSDSDR